MATPTDTQSPPDLTRYATAAEIAAHEAGKDQLLLEDSERPPAADAPRPPEAPDEAHVAAARSWDHSLWVPYCHHEYTPGLDHGLRPETRGVVIHVNDGTFQGTVHYFRSGESGGVGAHFEVGNLHEGVVQFVPLSRKCWHAVAANAFAIGVEHAGFGRSRAEWMDSPGELHLSANRVAWILHRYNLGAPRLEHNIWRHSDGGVGWGNHDCPGAYFPWDHYLSLVRKAYEDHWAR